MQYPKKVLSSSNLFTIIYRLANSIYENIPLIKFTLSTVFRIKKPIAQAAPSKTTIIFVLGILLMGSELICPANLKHHLDDAYFELAFTL